MAKKTFLTLVQAGESDDADGSRTLIERAYVQLRDDIVEGRTGHVCRPQDAKDLAQTIARYFAGPVTLGERNEAGDQRPAG